MLRWLLLFTVLWPHWTAAVKQITAGYDHTCARLGTGHVKCWGSGNSGRLGYGDTNNRGDGPNEMGNNLPVVDLGGTAVEIVTGGLHTCARLDGVSSLRGGRCKPMAVDFFTDFETAQKRLW